MESSLPTIRNKKTRMLTFTTAVQHCVLEIPDRAVRQEKEIKASKLEKK